MELGLLILFLVLMPVVLLVVGAAVFLFMGIEKQQQLQWSPEFPIAKIERPWWGNPFFWLGVSAVFAVLGFLVVPHFFGGVFVFLPFLWITPKRRRRPPVEDA